MSKLSAFLHPELNPEKEIVISNRFKDENGEPIPFKIRPITQEENEALIKKCTIVTKDKGEKKKLDSVKYSRSLVVAGTVFPNFDDAELCKAYGVLDPLMVPSKMLYIGEYNRLADEIAKLSGLDEGSAEEESKN